MAGQLGRHGGDERVTIGRTQRGGGVGDGQELGLA
jgi:hypothetical protein